MDTVHESINPHFPRAPENVERSGDALHNGKRGAVRRRAPQQGADGADALQTFAAITVGAPTERTPPGSRTPSRFAGALRVTRRGLRGALPGTAPRLRRTSA